MKNFSIGLLFTLCLACPLVAQTADDIDELIRRAKTERVTLNYSCTISSIFVGKIQGKLIVQGDCYYAEGYGLRIYCDGGTRWTIDREAREITIEDAYGIAEVLGFRDSVTKLEISDVQYSPQSASSVFTFDMSHLDSSWIITDLRGM